jgi:hypothetical protein
MWSDVHLFFRGLCAVFVRFRGDASETRHSFLWVSSGARIEKLCIDSHSLVVVPVIIKPIPWYKNPRTVSFFTPNENKLVIDHGRRWRTKSSLKNDATMEEITFPSYKSEWKRWMDAAVLFLRLVASSRVEGKIGSYKYARKSHVASWATMSNLCLRSWIFPQLISEYQ